MIWLVGALCGAAAAYQILAIVAAFRHLGRRDPACTRFPGISVLKPVRGRDSRFFEAIRSHALLRYPEFELLFGVRDHGDAALADIDRLRSEFPRVAIRVVFATTPAPNGKVGVLHDLALEAKHPVFVVNDSDILVQPDYLQQVIAPLEDPHVGLVTCLYRATADSAAARWEALGIATDFAPSALVAPLVGVKEFGLGSTLAFRAADLQRLGGFGAVADYIADDYQIGKRISQLGLRVWLSRTVVQTHLGAGSWADVWAHQLRWARTIRLSRGAYLGLPISNATLWALLAGGLGMFPLAATLLLLRVTSGLLTAKAVLADKQAFFLMPFRDLWGFAVWCAALRGKNVIWRDQKLLLDAQGRITSVR